VRYLWLAAGLTSAGIGIVAFFVPLIPSTVFLLIATYAFARSSERFHNWITNHPQFGPPIQNWHNGRVIARNTKIVATVSILIAMAIPILVGLPVWIPITTIVILSGVITYIWSRPEQLL
jgi:uncharacterized membrane protein YbaN (DUF454 family)